MKLLILIMVVWNAVAFLMMAVDKRKAVNDKRRISEKTLILSSFLMGALGIGAGMLVFHHKTRKAKFQILVPLALLLNGFIIYELVHLGIV